MPATAEAVSAIFAESAKHKKLQGPIYLGLFVKQNISEKRQEQPILVSLPHKTRRSDETTTCLVVKDPQNKLASVIDTDPVTKDLFDEIIGVGKLRRRLHSSKKSIHEFASSFTHIFVQDKVAKPLAEVLGASYYKTAKHLPVPVMISEALDGRMLRYQVRRAIKSSQIIPRPSQFTSVTVGNTKMDQQKVVDNVDAAISFVKKQFPGAKFHIKTPESMSLPID